MLKSWISLSQTMFLFKLLAKLVLKLTLRLLLLPLLLPLLLLFGFGLAQHTFAQAPKQVQFMLGDDGGSCPNSIALYDGLRLTFQFPSKVRVAVPSHDQMIDIFISGRLIVVNPSSNRRSDQSQVTLTTELSSHQAFICKFTLFDQQALREHDQPIELIRVQSQQGQKRIESEALELLAMYMKQSALSSQTQTQSSSTLSPFLSKQALSKQAQVFIASWQANIEQQHIQRLMTARDFELSANRPVRAQEHLIYVVIERVIRAHHLLHLRVKLQNHSQKNFELYQVYSQPKNINKSSTLPTFPTASLWSINQPNQIVKTLNLKAGDGAHYLSLSAPQSVLKDSLLIFRSTDGRSIHIDMSEFDEL